MFSCVLILMCMHITATIYLLKNVVELHLKAGKLYRSVNALERSHHLRFRLNVARLIYTDYSMRSAFPYILLGCTSELYTCMHFIMIVYLLHFW